jgi:hypothetical protein
MLHVLSMAQADRRVALGGHANGAADNDMIEASSNKPVVDFRIPSTQSQDG